MNNYFCTLSIRRNIYPPTSWHWCIEMPNGHMFTCSKGCISSLADVLADAATNGAAALIRAEDEQAKHDEGFARAIGRKS